MNRLIKTLSVKNGKLFVIAAGQRLPLAGFSGRIEIIERTALVPVLGTVQKGTKTIYASFIVCGNLEYQRQMERDFIHSGKVYEAHGDVEGEVLHFAGMRFEDSDPLNNELMFEITDLELIQKMLAR